MLEILKNKKCDKTNGKINFCIISEEELKVMIEIAKRENQELKKYKSLYENEKEEHEKEIKEYQEELEKADSITQSCIFMGSKESGILYRQCLNELETYKKLYQNEKDHTDTLKRIIKKIEEYINKNNLFCYKYDEEELFEIITDKESKKYLLDLLKEIK